MKLHKDTKKNFFTLADNLVLEIIYGKCQNSILITLYKLMITLKIGVAFHRLGFYYLTGELNGISIYGCLTSGWVPNYNLALRYLKRAYALGIKESAHDIASTYFQEVFEYTVKRNVEAPKKLLREMLKWIKLALPYEHGDRRARMYHYQAWNEFHYGDKSKAIFLWKKAARNGGAYAMLELGIVYGWGEGVAKNLKVATRYFHKCVACDSTLIDVVRISMRELGLKMG